MRTLYAFLSIIAHFDTQYDTIRLCHVNNMTPRYKKYVSKLYEKYEYSIHHLQHRKYTKLVNDYRIDVQY